MEQQGNRQAEKENKQTNKQTKKKEPIFKIKQFEEKQVAAVHKKYVHQT